MIAISQARQLPKGTISLVVADELGEAPSPEWL
jgi:hypothetical protein